jgi:hypothetical protein
MWWNKESEILKSHLKCFSLEKHIGVRRKEDTANHATSYEILCEKENPRIEVKFSHLKNPVSNMVIIRRQLTKEADRYKVIEIINSFKITSKYLDISIHRHEN